MSIKSPGWLRRATGTEVTDQSQKVTRSGVRNWSRRTRIIVIAAGVVVGTGTAATATAVVIHERSGDPAATAGVAADTQRLAAAERADRATRPTPAEPSPGASSSAPASPGAAAGPKATPARPKPTRVVPVAPPAPSWVVPMLDAAITSCYGPRWGSMHQGIDFANAEGTPIRAAAAGTVISAGDDGDGYGNKVVIQHGPGLFTLYGHSEQVLVQVGQWVTPGQVIALEGATGDATGPHLHFEVWTAMWSRIDPAPFLRAHGIPVNGC